LLNNQNQLGLPTVDKCSDGHCLRIHLHPDFVFLDVMVFFALLTNSY
jgi:hypothetical protein